MNGYTVAVLGSGIDRIYPSENAELCQKIVDQRGCVLSEYAPGESVTRWSLAARDRIQAALSHIVFVVESKIDGGAMITADYAMKYNRKVATLINSQEEDIHFSGNMELIRKGSTPVNDHLDIQSICEKLTLLVIENRILYEVDREFLGYSPADLVKFAKENGIPIANGKNRRNLINQIKSNLSRLL